MKSPVHGTPRIAKSKAMLIGLLLLCVAMVSGCGSNLPMPLCPQSQVTVDQTLMAEPNYTQTLLDFLSEKPSELTPK